MTTAKEVLVSGDGGTTFDVLPGGTGEWHDEANQITDTIFGQTFASTQPGLITWTCNANAIYKGFAGYVAKLLQTGTSTSMTAEATTLVSGKTYQITASAKRIIDWTKAVVVKDSGSAVSGANILSINYLWGQVTFVGGYTVLGAITIDGWYLPTTEISKGSSFTLTQTAATLDKTDFPTARGNNGYRVFDPGLRTVTLNIGGFYDSVSEFWTVLEGRENIVIEINPDGSSLSRARGVFKLVTRNQAGDVGALETETRDFNLAVPENVATVFSWMHDPATTLAPAVKHVLDSWLAQDHVVVRYLPDGPTVIGFQGTAVVTDVSLSSSLDAMNTFAANFQGSNSPTRAIF